MTLIAGVKFRFDLAFDELDLKETEEYLQSIVFKYSDLIYDQNTKVHVQLSDGSLRVSLAVVGAIYLSIGQYGSFRSGVDQLIKDAKSMRDLVTNQIVKNGLDESYIMENKRMYCDPDRIRRVLLAIERIESNSNISKADALKEVSKIKTSVQKICYQISSEDAGLFMSSLSEKYWPNMPNIPYFIESYKLVAREEDIIHYPVESLDSHRVNKVLQRRSR